MKIIWKILWKDENWKFLGKLISSFLPKDSQDAKVSLQILRASRQGPQNMTLAQINSRD